MGTSLLVFEVFKSPHISYIRKSFHKKMASTGGVPYLGSKISLISKSEIRYEGILYTIDTKDSTVALSKVQSFGTEDRPTDRPVAPRDEIYEYIIFRGTDIKDIRVCQPPKPNDILERGLPNDPAIVEHSSTIPSNVTVGSQRPIQSSSDGVDASYDLIGSTSEASENIIDQPKNTSPVMDMLNQSSASPVPLSAANSKKPTILEEKPSQGDRSDSGGNRTDSNRGGRGRGGYHQGGNQGHRYHGRGRGSF